MIHHPRSPTPWRALNAGLAGPSDAEAQRLPVARPGNVFDGAVFTRLFVPVISYRLIERFREDAAALLPKAESSRLISLCQSISAPRVSFETTEREAA
jgi:hypothetical protein